MTFSPFDWDHSILKVVVTAGGSNQSTGGWVPESSVETAITGHVSDVTLKEMQLLDQGLIDAGVRNLAVDTSVGLKLGDRIKITEPDSSVSEWNIESKSYHPGLLNRHAGVSRETFLLRRRV